ncbi:UNVERIFIED_CONTAM: hypothetical protein ACS92_07670 [Bacillus cereus]
MLDAGLRRVGTSVELQIQLSAPGGQFLAVVGVASQLVEKVRHGDADVDRWHLAGSSLRKTSNSPQPLEHRRVRPATAVALSVQQQAFLVVVQVFMARDRPFHVAKVRVCRVGVGGWHVHQHL